MKTEMTDEQKRAALIKLGELLGLAFEGEPMNHGASYKVNEFQSIWVRLCDWKGKGSAQLGPAKMTHLPKRSDLYFTNDKVYESIGFSGDKAVEAIAKDITKRLLNSQFQADSLDYIRERVKAHCDYHGKKASRLEKLKAIGFDDHEAYAYKYLGGTKRIEASLTSNDLKIQNMDEKTFYKIIKMVMATATVEEEV